MKLPSQQAGVFPMWEVLWSPINYSPLKQSSTTKRMDVFVLCTFCWGGESVTDLILSQKSDRKLQQGCLHILPRSTGIKISPAVEDISFCFWSGRPLHLGKLKPNSSSTCAAAIYISQKQCWGGVCFPLFLFRWFDFAEEWSMSLAVNLKICSHHHWPSKVVILFFQELTVVTNKPWSKCRCLCSHITLQHSTHARIENADTGDHATPLPFLVSLPFDLISGRGSGKRFQYWAQKSVWFIIGSANLAKLQRRVEVQTDRFHKHLLLSNTPHLFWMPLFSVGWESTS